jgi:TolB-like protein/Tfp pilus assembly protein PilF
MRLNPYYPSTYLQLLGGIYLGMEAYEKAVEAFKALVVREPQSRVGHRGLAIAYIRLGRKEQARSEVAEVLRLFPEYSLEVDRKQAQLMNKDPTVMENDIEALREAGLPEYSPIALPDKPSIAVLPFDNMSDDPEQEYFSDGMTEEIITKLSMNSGLAVIARNSTFFYKGKRIKIKQIAQELRARYVVEGSVRKAGNMVRITAQLIDATTESHLWAKTYDREFKDIFSLQDEIAQQIVATLNVKSREAEQKRVRRIPTENLTAYDSLLRGLSHFSRLTKEENAKARKMFERAVELDPEFAFAYGLLGFAHLMDYSIGWHRDPGTLEQVSKFARKALSLDDSSSLAHVLLSEVYITEGQFEQANSLAERALSLNPNNADAYLSMGRTLDSVGRSEEAVEAIKKAMQLDPHHAAYYNTSLARAYRNLGQYEEAIASLKEALARNPDWIVAFLQLAQVYQDLGQYKEAIASLKEALARDPDLIWAYFELAINYLKTWEITQSQDPLILDRALEMAEKTVAIDDSFWGSHFGLSITYLYKKQYEKALAEAEKVIALVPENADSYALLAAIFISIGRSEEAIENIEKAMQLNPAIPAWYLNTLATAYASFGRQTEAVATFKRVFDRKPSHGEAFDAHLSLAILYVELGQEEDARAEAEEILKLVPNFSVEVWGQRNPNKDQAQIERGMAALRKTGLN